MPTIKDRVSFHENHVENVPPTERHQIIILIMYTSNPWSDCRLKLVICKSLQFSFLKNNPHSPSYQCDNVEYLLSGICHSLLIGRLHSGGEPWNCHLSRSLGAWLCWYDLCRRWLCQLLCKLIVSLLPVNQCPAEALSAVGAKTWSRTISQRKRGRKVFCKTCKFLKKCQIPWWHF